jgi:peptide deformylase
MTPQEFLSNPTKTIVTYPNEILTTVAQSVEDINEWSEISKLMGEIMIENNGIGLAAPQIGLSYRAFIIRFSNQNILYLNPEIISSGNHFSEVEEGCLSLPGVHINVKRPQKIKVRWMKPNGKKQIATYEGLTSRVFQHELDHLNGKLINLNQQE